MGKEIQRLTSRHIAKLMTELKGSITPLVETAIKKEIRFLESDIINFVTGKIPAWKKK